MRGGRRFGAGIAYEGIVVMTDCTTPAVKNTMSLAGANGSCQIVHNRIKLIVHEWSAIISGFNASASAKHRGYCRAYICWVEKQGWDDSIEQACMIFENEKT